MAYPHYKYEVLMTPTNVTATTSGDKGNSFRPSLVNHIIRGFAITILNTGVVLTTGMVLSSLRIQGTQSGSTASNFATLFSTATDDEGDVIYTATLDQLVRPGERVVVNNPEIVTGSADYQAVIYVEVCPSEPGNALTSAVRSTSAT